MLPLKIRDEIAERTAAWHPWRRWSVTEAIEIMREIGLYHKSLQKAIIGLSWRIEEENAGS